MALHRGSGIGWLAERYDVGSWVQFLKKKAVPRHGSSLLYFLGGMTLFLFIVQVATGILLLLYYRPTAEAAFESVQFIMTQVRFGWLVRSIHSWSANLMVFFAFMHLFSVFFMKSYRKPRELTWVSGMLLLMLTLAFGFSGYLLPWNTLAFFATRVGTEIAGALPVIGPHLLRLMRGGEDVTGATLTRFFGFHVAVLPMLATALVLLHLLMVQIQGMSLPLRRDGSVPKESGKPMPFFPNFLLRDVLAWVVTIGILAALAAIFPWELGQKADPFAPAPAGIRPEWYFVFMFESLKLIPAKIGPIDGEILGIMGFGICALLLVLVPFLDRRARRGEWSLGFTILGIVAVIYIAAMTAVSYLMGGPR
jgi:cytochrome b6